MTEYTTSPEAYEEYMSSRERTAYWVQAHSSSPDSYYSPSVPPTEIDGLVSSSPPSEAGSARSLPPKMVLRYNDGRPDIPIPQVNAPLRSRREGQYGFGAFRPPPHHRSHTSSIPNGHPSQPIPVQGHSSHRARTGSHAAPSSHSRRHEPLEVINGSPEEIRVLPSHGRSHHSRSKSLPRSANGELVKPTPAVPSQSRPGYPGTSHRSHASHAHVNFAPPTGVSAQAWHGGIHSSTSSGKHSYKHPPAIVYAPSHQPGRTPHYAPPALLYHPPQRGPDGMIYSHSAPVPIQGGQYPAPTGAEEFKQRRRERTRSVGPGVVHKVRKSDGEEDSEAESAGSGSTYYVLPTAGQKVHVIAPSREQSVITATSTTKSPASSPRKPFFQRLFSFAKIGSSSGGSTKGRGRKLVRRHSTGNSGRPKIPPVQPIPPSDVPQ